jgi:flagellar basal body-associated protein FliL
MSEQSAQSIRWIRLTAVFLIVAVVGCFYFCWMITHELSDLKNQVADLRQLVIVDQDARIRQTEVVINDIESSLMPGISDAQSELRNIGKDMHEVKALLRSKGSKDKP